MIDSEDEEHGWKSNEDYLMKAEGLFSLEGDRVDDRKNGSKSKVRIGRNGIEINDNGDRISIDKNGVRINESTEDDYRYDNRQPTNSIDSLQRKLYLEKQRTRDSLEKVKENINKQIEKIDVKEDEPEALSGYKMQSYMVLINI